MEHLEDTIGKIRKSEFTFARLIDKDIYMDEIIHGPDHYPKDDNSFDKFHSFPTHHGWKIGEDNQLEYDATAFKADDSQLADQAAKLLQTWLFFGLIYTIVCDENGTPLLRFHELCDGQNLSTARLEAALARWHDSVVERKKKNHDQARLYMVSVELALHAAKMVIRKNLGFDNGKALYSSAELNQRRCVTDDLALTLMALGETLSLWKVRIMESTKTFIRGWHSEEEDEGWGPPGYVISRMQKEGWCIRAIHLLQSQLRSSATLLLAAYLAHGNSDQQNKDRGRHSDMKCTEQACNVVSAAGELDKYETAHLVPNCGCEKVEVDMRQVLKILASKDPKAIPLLKIKTDKERRAFSLTVHDLSEMGWKAQYGAISHVWSDGWGNEEGNWLWTCQVGRIFQMLEKGAKKRNIRNPHSDTVSIPFWMDTLIIPANSQVKNGDSDYNTFLRQQGLGQDGSLTARTLRTKGIEQIGAVYPQANFTIVLDNGLSSIGFDSSASCHSGMSVLASAWMKRLWTLQEAVLSRKLYITARPNGRDDGGIVDLDELLNELAEVSDGGEAGSFTSITRNHLTDSIMHSARKKPDDSLEDFKVKDPAKMVADAWRAARWRCTSIDAHEPLALATLMKLPYAEEQDSQIKGASLPTDANMKPAAKRARRDQLAKEFWTLFDREYEGHIPSGLIFLPGSKVNLRGFGWAPSTFMEAYKLDYPDPFKKGSKTTKLSREFGLKVHYPGIMLHCIEDEGLRNSILGTGAASTDEPTPFKFPVDPHQWYAIQPADRITHANHLNGVQGRRTRLAIILTRPSPREQPQEIALLVEIYKELGEGGDSITYCCQIVRRVKIWLDVSPIIPGDVHRGNTAKRQSVHSHPSGTQRESNAATDRTPAKQWALSCLGEVLDSSQAWYVDGIVEDREQGLPDFRKSPTGRTAPDTRSISHVARGPLRSRQLPMPQVHQPQPQPAEGHEYSDQPATLPKPGRQQPESAGAEEFPDPPPPPPSLPRSATYQPQNSQEEPSAPRQGLAQRAATYASMRSGKSVNSIRKVASTLIRSFRKGGGKDEVHEQGDSTAESSWKAASKSGMLDTPGGLQTTTA